MFIVICRAVGDSLPNLRTALSNTGLPKSLSNRKDLACSDTFEEDKSMPPFPDISIFGPAKPQFTRSKFKQNFQAYLNGKQQPSVLEMPNEEAATGDEENTSGPNSLDNENHGTVRTISVASLEIN